MNEQKENIKFSPMLHMAVWCKVCMISNGSLKANASARDSSPGLRLRMDTQQISGQIFQL